MESYRTVKQETNAEFIEKRSKFIGYIKPVQTEEEAIAFIQSIKSKHWDATHNVYAYSLRDKHAVIPMTENRRGRPEFLRWMFCKKQILQTR